MYVRTYTCTFITTQLGAHLRISTHNFVLFVQYVYNVLYFVGLIAQFVSFLLLFFGINSNITYTMYMYMYVCTYIHTHTHVRNCTMQTAITSGFIDPRLY